MKAGSRAAIAEARAWQHNAAAWSERLAAAFPLYADLTQPLALAVLEASAGLGLLADAAEGLASGSGAREGGAAMEVVVAQLLAFPPLAQGGAGAASVVPLDCVLARQISSAAQHTCSCTRACLVISNQARNVREQHVAQRAC